MTITLEAKNIQLNIRDTDKYTEWIKLQSEAIEKKGGFLTITLEFPKRPRTTGELSQNNHIMGHCRDIAEQLDYQVDYVYEAIKRMACGTLGYPTHLNEIDGTEEPLPQKYASVEQASLLIKMCHVFADRNHLWLIEQENGQPVKTVYGKKKGAI